jgi:hypothetical protein
MSEMDRREFISMLICTLAIANLPAEQVEAKAITAKDPVDENFWIGGY